jgi:hypothetical protein
MLVCIFSVLKELDVGDKILTLELSCIDNRGPSRPPK